MATYVDASRLQCNYRANKNKHLRIELCDSDKKEI